VAACGTRLGGFFWKEFEVHALAMFDTEADILVFSSTLLLLLLNVHSTLGQQLKIDSDEELALSPFGQGSILDANWIAAAILQNFRLCSIFNLGYWVKPKSTT
jgi:hypothetical protein